VRVLTEGEGEGESKETKKSRAKRFIPDRTKNNPRPELDRGKTIPSAFPGTGKKTTITTHERVINDINNKNRSA